MVGTVPDDRVVITGGPDHRRRQWRTGGLIVLALAAAAVVVALAPRYGSREFAVVRRDIIAHESLAGRVVAPPNAIAFINSHWSAPVSRVLTAVGRTVHKGDIVVELSHPTAAANYQAAQQELRLARDAFRQAEAVYANEIRQAKTRLADARAEREYAAQRIEIPTAMGEEGATAPGTNLALQQAEQFAAQAEAELTAATRRSNDYLEPYRQRLAAATESFAEAQEGDKVSFVRAPLTGQVLELNARPGQAINQVPDGLVATIADLDALRIHARLGDAQWRRVRPGMPVTIRLSDLPEETFSGEVLKITVEAGGQMTNREREIERVAVIGFINRQGLARPEMGGQAVVQTERANNALSVPVEAVKLDADGRPFVRVRRLGRWVRTPVEIGPSDGMYVAIPSGLSEGSTVRVPGWRRAQPDSG